jgi:hypothetical protein
MTERIDSWQRTDQEKQQWGAALSATVAASVGPLAPVAVWVYEYVHARRHLILSKLAALRRTATWRTCRVCGSALAVDGSCPNITLEAVFQCGWCVQRFTSYQLQRKHERRQHWTARDFVQSVLGNR